MSVLMTALFFCQADCVAVDVARKTVQPMGAIESTSEVSKLEAFRLMKRDCRKLLKGSPGTPTLVKGFDYQTRVEKCESSDGISGGWQPASFPASGHFNYSWSAAGTFHSNYYADNDFRLHLDFARVLDPAVCGHLEKNPEGKPRYAGDEDPLG